MFDRIKELKEDGFVILAFVPMPIFSAFGILTVLRILMAFIAALLVLPSMLMLVDRTKKKTFFASSPNLGLAVLNIFVFIKH